MAEYIEREALNKIMEIRRVKGDCKLCAKYERCIENKINRKGSHLYCWEHINFPSADVVEVRHGEWLDRPKDYYFDGEEPFIVGMVDGSPYASCYCSECGEWLVASDEYPVKGHYCPNCGAKMDGKNGTK